MLANGQAGQPDGKCNREQTADGLRAQARVKRWGKSPPALRVTGAALQTPPGARPDRGDGDPPIKPRVGRRRPAATSVPDGWSPEGRKAPNRIRLTGGLENVRAPERGPSSVTERRSSLGRWHFSEQAEAQTGSEDFGKFGQTEQRAEHLEPRVATDTHCRRQDARGIELPHGCAGLLGGALLR